MINFEKLIVSLEIYNFHLFINYLDGNVEIIKFDNFQTAFHKVDVQNLNYIEEIKADKGNLLEVGFTKNHLVAINDSKFLTQNLFDEFDKNLILFENEFEQLYVNHESHKIDLLTTDNRLASINIDSYKERNFKKNKFEIDDNLTVTNLKSKNENTYLSIRGYGVKKLNSQLSVSFRTEDAQDLEILSNNNVLVVADAFEGIILFDLKKNKQPIKKVRFDNDIIQEIRAFQKMLLLKGKNGLYIYDFNYDKKYQIFEGSVGAFTSYYDMIFFTNKNKVNMITKDNASLKSFKLLRDKIDINTEKIKNYS